MAKISKTYTIEEETLNIVRENKEDRNLSSDSASLERIVLEWAVLKGNNNGTSNVHSNIDINKIVEKVLDRLQEDNKKRLCFKWWLICDTFLKIGYNIDIINFRRYHYG